MRSFPGKDSIPSNKTQNRTNFMWCPGQYKGEHQVLRSEPSQHPKESLTKSCSMTNLPPDIDCRLKNQMNSGSYGTLIHQEVCTSAIQSGNFKARQWLNIFGSLTKILTQKWGVVGYLTRGQKEQLFALFPSQPEPQQAFITVVALVSSEYFTTVIFVQIFFFFCNIRGNYPM